MPNENRVARRAWWSLAGLVLAGACACSRPAQQDVRPPPEVTPPPPRAEAPASTDAGPAAISAVQAAPADEDAGSALSIAQFVRLKPASGTHLIRGIVTRVAPCPPCPEGAACKPCMGDYLVISDQPGAVEDLSRLGTADLIVFADPALLERVTPGQRYRLTVRVRPGRTTAQPLHDVELVDLAPSP